METKGWIVTLSNEGEMALVQPLTRVQIHLPNMSRGDTDPLYAVQRAVLSSPPDPQNKRDWVLVILHGSSGEVGFCRSGDKVWTVVDNFGCGNQSLEYYRGKIYVANHSGQVGEHDVVGKSNGFSPVSPRKTKIDFEEYSDHDQSYIVSSRDSLFVIFREGIYQCSGFWVFEIDVEKESFKKVKSLGTRTIFLGHNPTLCVDTIRCPELIPNSIYFTDDFFERYAFEPEGGGMNMGVYSLEDKSVQSHYNGKSFSLICPPVWTYLTTK